LHDRYLYLPSVGFCLLAGIALTRILAGKQESSAHLRTPVAAAMVTIGLMGLNISQHEFWRDDVALYQRGVRTDPRSGKVKLNLTNALADRGRYEEAIPLYLEMLDDPEHQWPLLYNLGYSYYRLGKLQDAEKYLEKAIAVDPSNADEHKYAGLTQAELGRPTVAEEHLKTAIRLKPKGVGYHRALAEFYEQQGKTQDALTEYRAELSLTPEDSELKRHVEELEHSLSAHPTDATPNSQG
jgi:protein O-mannosyl-transferase